jgi:hypothetical protein
MYFYAAPLEVLIPLQKIPARPRRGSAEGWRVGDQGLTYDCPGAVGGSRVAPAGSVGGGRCGLYSGGAATFPGQGASA